MKTKTGSRAFSISGTALLNALPVPIRNAETILAFLVDEPDLASIMTHDHAKDLCASELSPLRI